MATSSVALDKTQYVRVNIGYTSMILEAHNDSVRIVLNSVQPALGNTTYHMLGGSDAPLTLSAVDTNVWALAMTEKSSLIVTEFTRPVATQLKDSTHVSPLIAGFGELLTGTKNTDIQVQFTYNLANEMVTDGSTGTGSATHNQARAVISSGAGVGLGRLTSVDSVIYRAGHDVVAFFTVAFSPGEANTFQHIGPHDDENGYQIGFEETTFAVNRIRDSVDNITLQADFSEDTLDGNGPSGYTLNPEVMNIFSIKYGHLGKLPTHYSVFAGGNRGWITFHVDGPHPNKLTNIINPNLPIRADAERTAGTGAVIVHTASWHVCTIGEPAGRAGSRHFTAKATKPISLTTFVPLFSLRNKTQYPTAAPVTNHIPVLMEFLSLTSDGNKSVEFAVFENAVLSGTPLWTDKDAINSVIEIDTSATGVTGKETIPIGLAKVDSEFIRLDKDDVIIRPGEIITIAARMLFAAGTSDVTAAGHWNEQF